MAHVKIVINDRTLIDRPIDQWQQKAPDELAAMLKPGHRPEPAMQALQVTLVDALLRDKPFNAVLTTRAESWNLKVSYA